MKNSVGGGILLAIFIAIVIVVVVRNNHIAHKEFFEKERQYEHGYIAEKYLRVSNPEYFHKVVESCSNIYEKAVSDLSAVFSSKED